MSLSSRPVPSSHSNPCPVCNRTHDGDCRILEDGAVFCRTHVDARKGERINGYVCVKTSNGHTATFKPDNRPEWTEDQKAVYQASRTAKEAKRAANHERIRSEKISRELPAKERDYWFKQLLAELTLSDEDKEHLLGRGFTEEQIINDGYRSITSYYKPTVNLLSNFPGLLPDLEFGLIRFQPAINTHWQDRGTQLQVGN